MRFTPLATVLLVAATSAFAAGTPAPSDKALAEVIAGSHRSGQYVARDEARHPQELLEYFGIRPNMTVVQIWNSGYWIEILAPYLKDKGTLYTALLPASASENAAKVAEEWKANLIKAKAIYGDVNVTEFGPGAFDNIAPPESADMVLTFRNVHIFMKQGFVEEAFPAFFKALKPGGILGVEDHRANTDQPQDPKAGTGYVREDYVIALAEKAGFEFIGKSEVLANPRDTRDHPKGVWTLPPQLMLGDQDREKYLAIGEADNFALKFRKPKKP